jgi:hypothetical protein
MWIPEEEWMRRRRKEREIMRAKYALVRAVWVLGLMLLCLVYVFFTADL